MPVRVVKLLAWVVVGLGVVQPAACLSAGSERSDAVAELAASREVARSPGEAGAPGEGGGGGGTAMCPPPPNLQTGLIDDFEDGDGDLPTDEGLVGSWITFDDTYDEVDDDPTIDIERDPDDPTNWAGHTVGGDHRDHLFGGGLSARFRAVNKDVGCAMDGEHFDGVALRLKFTGGLFVELETLETALVGVGGDCDGLSGSCFDTFHAWVVGDGTWQDVVIPFRALSQDGWGAPVCFNVSGLLGLNLFFPAEATPYDVWIDDVRFVQNSKPTCSAPSTGLLDDFEDGDLALPGGGDVWTVYGGEARVEPHPEPRGRDSEVLHLQPSNLVAPAYEVAVRLASGDNATCGVDASGFEGIEIRGRFAGGGGLVSALARQACGRSSLTYSWAWGPEWGIVRLPFNQFTSPLPDDLSHPNDDGSTLQRLAFQLEDDAWIDEIRLYTADDELDIGKACETDADCYVGHCMPSGPGAPADGMCTLDCSNDSQCESSQEGSSCLENHCVEGCTPNLSSPDKCHGREDMACIFFGACIPRCRSDAQCDAGLFCQTRSGVCDTEPSTGLPHGTPCDPEAQPSDDPDETCNGLCDPVIRTCTTPCTIGDPEACSGVGAGCLPLLGSWGEGDRGLCGTLCDCNAQCPAGLRCSPVVAAVPLAKVGICAAEESAGIGLVDCVNECVDGPVRACRGEGDCLGSAQCRDDKQGYEPCRCADASAGGEGGASDAGQGGLSGGEAGAGTGGTPGSAGRGPGRSTAVDRACACSEPGRRPRSNLAALLMLGLVGLAGARARHRPSHTRP